MKILLALGALLYMVGAHVFPALAAYSAADKAVRASVVLHYGHCYKRTLVDGATKRYRTDAAVEIPCTEAILAAYGRKPNPCGRFTLTNYGMGNPNHPSCAKRNARWQHVAFLMPNLTRLAPRIITEADFRRHVASAGWPERLHDQVLAIARCESGDGKGGLDAHARNDSDRRGPALGVLQIHVPAHLNKIKKADELYDPEINAEVGLRVYEEAGKKGDPWLPWSESALCWKNKAS